MAEAPIEIWRGANDPPVVWEFLNADGSPCDLTGYTFDLTLAWGDRATTGFPGAAPSGEIAHSSDPIRDSSLSALVIVAAAGRVTWPITRAESQAIPRLQSPTYELFGTISGRSRPWAGGAVKVKSYLR